MEKDIETTSNKSEDIYVGVQPLELNKEAYRSELDEFDLTPAQADELLSTLWSIMSGFVTLGFDYDVCGQIFQDSTVSPPLALSKVDLNKLDRR